MSEPAVGQFVWPELMTGDLEAAKAFYTKVVGWGTMPFGEGDPPYMMWTAGETPVGGLMKTPAEAAGSPPMWFQYISTADVDSAAAQLTSLGGTVHMQPRDIPTIGRFSVVADPQGATFCLFTPVQGGGQPARPDMGGFSWFELATTDVDAAFDFYSRLFGWQKTESMDMGGEGTYQMFGRDGESVGGMAPRGSDQPGPPMWIGYADVPDIDESARRIAELGGTIVYGPTVVPGGGRALSALDPQQAIFGLFSPPAE